MKRQNPFFTVESIKSIAFCSIFSVLGLIATNAMGDVFNDAVDIAIDDVSAGVAGVAGVAQVPLTAGDLELEHIGPGGFDVDINPSTGCDFFVTITHFAPLDGVPVGSFDWKISDIELRDGDGNLLAGKVTGIFAPPGNANAMPTTGLAATDNSVTISTGPFSSIATGALNDYIVIVSLTGDLNGDCKVNLLDIAPFVDLLAAGGYQEEADTNGDGVLNLLDVAGFVDLLSN